MDNLILALLDPNHQMNILFKQHSKRNVTVMEYTESIGKPEV
jgi:hypothetical protein